MGAFNKFFHFLYCVFLLNFSMIHSLGTHPFLLQITRSLMVSEDWHPNFMIYNTYMIMINKQPSFFH